MDNTEIKRLSGLCAIELTEKEIEAFKTAVAPILDVFSEIESIDFNAKTNSISHDSLREDAVSPSFLRDKILANTESENGFFKVKRRLK